MREVVKNLHEVVNIADDVMVFGVGKEQFQQNVISFLDHLNHLTRSTFKSWQTSDWRQTLTKQGLKMDNRKWEVIQQWPTPTNVKELQSFLGSVNYLSKFIPYLSDFRWPLQELLKKDRILLHDEAFRSFQEFEVSNCKRYDTQVFSCLSSHLYWDRCQ